MTDFAWLVLAVLAILLLFPVGYLAGFARGRNAKVLTAICEDYLELKTKRGKEPVQRYLDRVERERKNYDG